MGNPLARRLRLAHALTALREQAGDTMSSLATRSGVSGSAISRLENPTENIGRKTSIVHIRKLLDALGVPRDGSMWRELDGWAETGAHTYWWDHSSYARMGARQKWFAVAEHDAVRILDYAPFLVPGLLQTDGYARYRAQVGTDGQGVDVEAVVAGRLQRQASVFDSGRVVYELVLEEQTVRRWPVPGPIMLGQLRHLLAMAEREDLSIRVLRVDAQVANGCGAAPRTPHTIYSYSDPGDPQIVCVDTVTEDLLITGSAEVDGYARLHERLRRAALSDADSVALIREVADELAARL
jgi:transcriptional regulator with XRE-family HTH domain